MIDPTPTFDGSTYEPGQDHDRLATALGRVYQLMSDGQWRTLPEIAEACGCSESGASARLRDYRKAKFRELFPVRAVNSRRREAGLWEYQVISDQLSDGASLDRPSSSATRQNEQQEAGPGPDASGGRDAPDGYLFDPSGDASRL